MSETYQYQDDAKKHPEKMEAFIETGSKVLDHADKVPKALIKACGGIMLVNAQEGGFFLSAQGGSGVALAHKDGKWSAPIAVNMIGGGAGAVFGYADKQMLILLNHFAMDRLLKGDGSFSIGVDLGFAVGKTGRAAAADIAISSKGGLGSSFVYTFSKGALFSIEAVLGGRFNPPEAPNKSFYGTVNHVDILEGKVPVPDGSPVPALWEKLDNIGSDEGAEE